MGLEIRSGLCAADSTSAATTDRTLAVPSIYSIVPPNDICERFHKTILQEGIVRCPVTLSGRAQWVPRGRVLRCHIEDDEKTVIYIDDRAFDLAEFGGLLRFFLPGGASASPSCPKTRSRSNPRSRCASRRTWGIRHAARAPSTSL